MLSNTAERKPRPKAVSHDAAGSFSTGIIAAVVTSARRNIVPLKVAGRSVQSGLRNGAEARIATHTAAPITGKTSSTCGNSRLATTLATIATTRMKATMPTRAQSTRTPAGGSFMIGEYACCWRAAITPKIARAAPAPTNPSRTSSGSTPAIHIIVVVVSPTTLPEPPPLDAATIAAR